MGQPPEDAIRSCLLATSLARRMDLSERDVGDVYYTTLLQHVGCTAYAHETAVLFGGDDIAVRAGGSRIDFANPKDHAPLPGRRGERARRGTRPLPRQARIRGEGDPAVPQAGELTGVECFVWKEEFYVHRTE